MSNRTCCRLVAKFHATVNEGFLTNPWSIKTFSEDISTTQALAQSIENLIPDSTAENLYNEGFTFTDYGQFAPSALSVRF